MRDVSKLRAERELDGGASGARVWLLQGGVVCKRAVRGEMSEAAWRACVREATFYRAMPAGRLACLPEILRVTVGDEETGVWMPLYRPFPWGEEGGGADALRALTEALAAVHSAPPPDFLRGEPGRAPLSAEAIAACAAGWLAVLGEHPGAFDEGLIERIAGDIGALEDECRPAERVLTHGDFHAGNALCRQDGSVALCDWQCVGLGDPAGDLSFFLSRLEGRGPRVGAEELAEMYCKARGADSPRPQTLLRSMRFSNVRTSFEFWHMYLRGADEGRVRRVYGEMARDYLALR